MITLSVILEFSLNVFTEFSEFSDKKIENQKGRLLDWNPGSPVYETEALPLSHKATGNRADPYTEPNSCLSDFSDSLNSLNSLKVLLHLEKTPLQHVEGVITAWYHIVLRTMFWVFSHGCSRRATYLFPMISFVCLLVDRLMFYAKN